MKLSNETYDILKMLTIRILPAVLTFVGVVMTALQMPYRDVVMTIGTAFITCLGTCLGISSDNYYADAEEEDM